MPEYDTYETLWIPQGGSRKVLDEHLARGWTLVQWYPVVDPRDGRLDVKDNDRHYDCFLLGINIDPYGPEVYRVRVDPSDPTDPYFNPELQGL